VGQTLDEARRLIGRALVHEKDLAAGDEGSVRFVLPEGQGGLDAA
jgi:hypothetical protein